MKYKKLLVFITCLLFVTVAVFCFTSAFKVTDIELISNSIVGSPENVTELTQNYLDEYEGKNLTFVNKDKIKTDVQSLSGYISVVSIEKKFPNKIRVEIKEKSEVFVIQNGNEFYALDDKFCVLAKKSNTKNNVTNNENLLIKLSSSDYDSDLKIGEVLSVYDSKLSLILNNSSNYLKNNKSSLSFVEFSAKKEGLDYKTITLRMKEGVSFTVLKADEFTAKKLTATHEFYQSLANKGEGEYIVVLKADGNISITQ